VKRTKPSAIREANFRLTVRDGTVSASAASDGVQALLGYAAADFLSGTVALRTLIHRDDQDIADMLFSPAQQSAEGDCNIRVRQASGRILCVRGHYGRAASADGVVVDLLLQDAKSLPRTMADAASVESFAAMMENTDDYIYFKDRNHVMVGASQTLVALCPPARHWTDLIGQTDYDIFTEPFADLYYSLEKKIFAGTPVAAEVQETLNSSGVKGWVDNRKYPIRNAGGELVGLFGIARDISGSKHLEIQLRGAQETQQQLIALNERSRLAMLSTLEDQQLAAAELKASEFKYQTMFDNAPFGVFRSTPAGAFISVNPALAIMLGYSSPAEAIRSVVSIADQHFVEPAERNREQDVARSKGQFVLAERRFRRVDGTAWIGLANTRTVFDASGKPQYYEGFIEDITVRRLAETDLRASEARYRATIDSANDAVLTIDSRGIIVGWNRSAERIFGFSEGEALGRPATAIMPSRFRAGHDAGLARVLSSDERRVMGSTVELAGQHKDGREFPIELSLAEWETGDGRFFTGVIRDITRRKRSEADVRLRGAALQAAANPIVITDRTGAVVWANTAFSTESGYQLNEAVGKNPRDLVKSGVHDQPFYKELWDTILAGKVWQGEMTNRRKDGTLYPEEMTITPVKNAEGEVTHFVAVKRNLTEEKGLRAQFLQAQKMESVGRLAAGVAHDFNNLLTVINGTADLAAMGLGDGDPLRADLEEIRKAGDRAAALTRQLLAFSRKQIMTPVVLNLGMVVEDLRSMLSRMIGEDVVLVVASANNVGNVLADPGQMEQVLVNMGVNARDAMPGGGTLTITVEDVELDKAFAATHPTVTAGRHVMLAVSDTGTGMSEEIRAMIFEPFFTTKGVGKGTGLGLSTVYGIVKQTGGSIWVDSDIGKGTTFTIYLPRVEAEVQQYQLRRSSVPVRGTETILIVEDEDALRDLARRFMELAGYRVLTAAGGVEAVQLLERLDGPVHLMLTDVVMPGISGPELAALVADSHPHMKVLFTSGYTDDAVLIRGILDQMTNFIKKPYEVATLTAKVREVLDSQDGQPTAGNGDREVVHSSQ